jgi:hypothetical protein
MKKIYTYVVAVIICQLLVSCHGNDQATCSAYFPVALINEATLYKVGESESYPFVHNGILYNEILDSLALNSEQWSEIIEIAGGKKSDSLVAIDYFLPNYVIIFRGGYHNYVSHLSISLSCEQLKYADNSGIHILSEAQIQGIKDWLTPLGFEETQ